jgi:hypothetical protein
VVAVAVLFVGFGSVGLVKLTLAVLVIVPFSVGLTRIVAVAVLPAAIVPRLQTTVSLLRVHVPCEAVAEPKPVVFGSRSRTVTPVAA